MDGRSGKPKRTKARHRVHLRVRSEGGTLPEVAENLSRSGLFVRDRQLKVGDNVVATLELPGFGSHVLNTRVAHVIDEVLAAKHSRSPGSGLQIVSTAKDYDEAIDGYLDRLEHRGDAMVLVQDDTFSLLLAATGFQVTPAPQPDDLVRVVRSSRVPVVAVVVARSQREAFKAAAAVADLDGIVVAMDRADELDRVLVRLDKGVLTSHVE